MQFSSALLETAVNEFAKLPGIGKKTALRLVLHLLKEDAEDVQHFSDVIARMRSEIKFCQRCHNVADADICSICANSMRKKDVICVVENIRDVIALESTQQFNGTYHVLGGVISPLDGIGPSQLNIETLVSRAQKDEVMEIIFALSPTIQGDTTIYFDVHHTKADVFEAVNKRELELGAINMAAMIYLIDKYGLPLSP